MFLIKQNLTYCKSSSQFLRNDNWELFLSLLPFPSGNVLSASEKQFVCSSHLLLLFSTSKYTLNGYQSHITTHSTNFPPTSLSSSKWSLLAYLKCLLCCCYAASLVDQDQEKHFCVSSLFTLSQSGTIFNEAKRLLQFSFTVSAINLSSICYFSSPSASIHKHARIFFA